MSKVIHPVAGTVAMLTIASLWLSTVLSEMFASQVAIAAVKMAIPWSFLLLVPALAAAGGSGFAAAKGRQAGLIGAKIKRMPWEDQAHAMDSRQWSPGSHPLRTLPRIQGESQRVRHQLLRRAGARIGRRRDEHHATRPQHARRVQNEGPAPPSARSARQSITSMSQAPTAGGDGQGDRRPVKRWRKRSPPGEDESPPRAAAAHGGLDGRRAGQAQACCL